MHKNEYCVHFDTGKCSAELEHPVSHCTLANTSPMDFKDVESERYAAKFRILFDRCKHEFEHENAANNNRLGQNTKTWIAFYMYMKQATAMDLVRGVYYVSAGKSVLGESPQAITWWLTAFSEGKEVL